MWSFGENTHGQLGHGDELQSTNVVTSPRLIRSLLSRRIRCSFVSAGWTHSACIGAAVDGDEPSIARIFTWGDNRHLQLGHAAPANGSSAAGASTAHHAAATPRPVALPSSHAAAQVHCGWRHTVALTSDGSVFSWGNNAHGQLSLGDFSSRAQPTLVQIASGSARALVALACAEVTVGWKHTLLMTRDRKQLYAAGSNAFGQLGSIAAAVESAAPAAASAKGAASRAVLKVCSPRLVLLPASFDSSTSSLLSIGAGWSHSLALTSAGQLFVWGRADMGQLSLVPSEGNKLIALPVEIALPAPFQCARCSVNSASMSASAALPARSLPRGIACGSEHSLLVCSRDVFVCGWNEHGNLGQGHSREVENKFRWSAVQQLHLCMEQEQGGHMQQQETDVDVSAACQHASHASSNEEQRLSHLRRIRAIATGGAAIIALH